MIKSYIVLKLSLHIYRPRQNLNKLVQKLQTKKTHAAKLEIFKRFRLQFDRIINGTDISKIKPDSGL